MIIVRLIGGLGNQMFQYALGRHLSIKYNLELKFDTTYLLARYKSKKTIFRNYDLSIFNIETKIASKKEILKFTLPRINNKYIHYLLSFLYMDRNVITEKFSHFDPEILLPINKGYLYGHWQSPKYFIYIEDIIRKDFTFRSPIPKESYHILNLINSSQSVCLNVRRGDYIENKILNTLVGDEGIKYYYDAITEISKKIENPMFFIFSDDIDWCVNNLVIKYPHFFVLHEHSGIKFQTYLQLMIQCKHFIIPNSTFAWWAAWLNQNPNKIVIVPKRWFNTEKLFAINDLLPTTWIKL